MFKKSICLIFLFLSLNVYAIVPVIGSSAPAEDASQQFPTVTADTNTSEAAVGSDSLPITNINTGINYNSEIGTTTLDKVTNEYGNMIIYDTNNTTESSQITIFQESNQSISYSEALAVYKASVDNNESNEVQQQKLKALRLASKKETANNGYTVARYESTFLKTLNPSGLATATVNTKILTARENATQAEVNATSFYKDTVSPMQATNTLKTLNDNVGRVGSLVQAYQYVKDFEKQVRSKIDSSTISCYISRELVPAFYCPYPDMTNTNYPDFSDPDAEATAMKVSSAEAKSVCDGVCQKQRSCVNYNILSDTNLDLSSVSGVNLYPSFADNNSSILIPATNQMELKTLTFKITATPSADFNGTAEDFDNYLNSSGIKFRTSINKLNEVPSIPPQVLVDKQITYVKAGVALKTFTILYAGSNFVIKNYKPYIYENAIDKYKEADIFKNIGNISIDEIKGEYSSKDLYFCAYKQLVNTTSECQNGTVIDLVNGASIYHVCTSSDKKLGPNVANGGFYTQESCEDACVESKGCLATYRHYADTAYSDPNSLYRAKVGCVDSEENQACTEAVCQSYFADGELRPLNEIVIQNDDTRIYTVRNKVLTGVIRPKINYDAELNIATTDYSALFQTEMKDAAYKSMIDNQSYDRVAYLIGESSPTKQAYQKDTINGKTSVSVLLKPNSFDIDNGTSYKIYSVLKFEQTYRPKYGIFMVGGALLNATSQDIQFKDITYIIKTPTGWTTFKQTAFAKIKESGRFLVCLVGSEAVENPTYTETAYIGQEYDKNTCNVQSRVSWNDIPSLTVDRNVFYDITTDTFNSYSLSEQAPYYNDMIFPANTDYQKYLITDWLERDLDETKGAMIRSQISKNNGASFGKVYRADFVGEERGWPANMYVYNFYSKDILSYNDILTTYLNDSNIVWELANPNKYASVIKDDTEIQSNNIKSFVLGTPNNTSLSLDITPKFAEENKRVFKFIFLYDKALGSPFDNYEINGSTIVNP